MMNLKTTSSKFLQYGKHVDYDQPLNLHDYEKVNFLLSNSSCQTLYSYDQDIYLYCPLGMAAIFIKKNLNEQSNYFVIHHKTLIKKNNYFNIVSITNTCQIYLFIKKMTQVKVFKEKAIMKSRQIRADYKLNSIYGVFYNVKSVNYLSSKEKFNFYELIYLDSGKIETVVDGNSNILKQNNLIIYKKDSYHTIKNISSGNCSYLSIMFSLTGKTNDSLFNNIFKLREIEINLLSYFVKTYEVDNPNRNSLLLSTLNLLINLLISKKFNENVKVALPKYINYENELLDTILNYIDRNIEKPLTIASICEEFSISRSTFQNLFKSYLKVTPKRFIADKKLIKAKTYLLDNKYSISDVSKKMSYSSIYYFSRSFKNRYGLNPSDFIKLYRIN